MSAQRGSTLAAALAGLAISAAVAAQTSGPASAPDGDTAATEAEDGAEAAASQPQADEEVPTVKLLATEDEEETEEEEEAASQPATQPRDPFFEQDIEQAFKSVDTEWKEKAEIEQESRVFVGPPPPYSELKKLLQRGVIDLKLKLRILGGVQAEHDTRRDGFEVRQLRAQAGGRLDKFFYHLQIDAVRQPILLDALVGYQPWRVLGFALGRTKVPFSGEYMTDDTKIEFAERAEIVNAVVPGREVGVQLDGAVAGSRVRYRVGAYNGADMRQLDFGRRLLYAGRIEGTPLKFDFRSQQLGLSLGVNAAFGWAERIDFTRVTPFAAIGRWSGTRLLAGADGRLRLGPAWIAGESIFANYTGDEEVAARSFWAWGGYGELGAQLVPRTLEVKVRYDALFSTSSERYNQFVIGGVTAFPTEFLLVSLNYAWGTGRGLFWSPHQLLASLQLVL
ncbi:MAG: hypothetical protein JXR83_19710 [Deltaproteobacteria bacterium]|nr:hypothetical protein [Deltaproteobacteria bacterium]